MPLTPANHQFYVSAEEATIRVITAAYEQGREAARNGWDHDPRTVPGVRLAASTREAYTRGYESGMEETADDRWAEELETSEGWDRTVGW